MKLSIGSLVLAALVAVATFSSHASANILSNPGFESGTGSDADDWGEIVGGPSGTVERSSVMPNTGSFHAYMTVDHVNNPVAGGAYFIEQNLGANNIDNSKNYNLSFFAKVDSTDFTGVNMFSQIQWLDQDGSDGGGVKGELLTALPPLGLNTTYQQFNLSDLDVPDGADSFLLRFQLAAGAVDQIQNGFYVDDAVLSQVPEPASLGLLLMGGFLTLSRRRRG